MKSSRVFLVASLVCLAVGLSQAVGDIMTGFALAMGGVFFILAFLTRLVAKAEATKS
jgi:hypothetical protein